MHAAVSIDEQLGHAAKKKNHRTPIQDICGHPFFQERWRSCSLCECKIFIKMISPLLGALNSTEIAQAIKHEDEKDAAIAAVDSAIVCGNVQRKPEWKYFTANCQCSRASWARISPPSPLPLPSPCSHVPLGYGRKDVRPEVGRECKFD